MKLHHAKTHDESIAGVLVECEWCGEEKRVTPSRAENTDFFLCSIDSDCKSEWQSENFSGEDNPRWKGGKATVECSWCSADVEKIPAKIERDGHHFCGGDADCHAKWCSKNLSGEKSPHWKGGPRTVECTWCGADIKKPPRIATQAKNYFCGGSDCYAKWRSEKLSGKNHPSWKGGLVTVECAWCGSDLERKPANATRHERHFCGNDNCWGEWLSENRTGENHPSWKGGSSMYGPGFTDGKKEMVRERQGRKCAGCGVHESEQPTRLSVHHIQNARTFNNAEARNDESNLVALCRSCHSTWEKMSPLRPQTAN